MPARPNPARTSSWNMSTAATCFAWSTKWAALPLGLACEYGRQAALALKSAHNCGVTHGDVSPLTLLLTPVKRSAESNGDVSIRPRPGATIKLVELGLTPRRPPVEELTYGQSDLIGPLAFSPPERLTSGERTAAGDMYGLGATLYFLLSTRPPHTGDSPLAVMLSLQQVEPTPLETLKSDLPPAVADLVRRLLSGEPSIRPSAAEVAEALSPYCEPTAKPPAAADEPGGILLAHETGTQPRVPTAIPVARDLEHPELRLDAGPFGEPMAEEIPPSTEQPLVEPLPDIQPLDAQHNGHSLLPEIQPLDEHHEANGDHLASFSHSKMGADAPRATRRRTRANSKNKMWLLVGLGLWLFAIFLWIGFATNWFSSTRSTETEHKKVTSPPKPKPKRG